MNDAVEKVKKRRVRKKPLIGDAGQAFLAAGRQVSLVRRTFSFRPAEF
jgi:hypothetical protein